MTDALKQAEALVAEERVLAEAWAGIRAVWNDELASKSDREKYRIRAEQTNERFADSAARFARDYLPTLIAEHKLMVELIAADLEYDSARRNDAASGIESTATRLRLAEQRRALALKNYGETK